MDVIRVCESLTCESVLVLGSTGFIGRCLLEKLLRSVTTITKIYCLIRPHKNKSVNQRLSEILNDPLFTSSSYCKALKSNESIIVAIEGDLLQGPRLGLSDDNLQILRNQVTCIYNAAGSSRLDDNLRNALNANVVTMKHILEFAYTVANLKCLICMSSIYTNCDRTSHIEEMLYSSPSDIDPCKVIRALEWMSDDMINAAEVHMLKRKPNAFVYTKWLAECLINDFSLSENNNPRTFQSAVSNELKNYLPIIVIRASMIGATYREPFPGWIDEKGASQPCNLFIEAAQGYLRTMRNYPGGCVDIIPVDVLVGIIIASSAYACHNNSKEIIVYNCTSDGGLKTPECAQLLNKVSSHNVPFEKAFRRPNLSVTGSSWIHSIAIIYSHLLPALIADASRVLLFKKPYFLNRYKCVHKNLSLVEYFLTHRWTSSNQNLLSLYFSLSPDDIHDFFIDPSSINWAEYIEGFLRGTKRYLLNEQECGIKHARNHLRNLRNMRWTFNFILLAFLWRIFIAKSQFAVNLWSVVLSFVYRFLTFMPLTAARTV